MTIETLTEDERGWLVADPEYQMWDVRRKVIRIIDAQAVALAEARAECERLRAQAESWERGHGYAWDKLAGSEAECERLRGETRRADQRAQMHCEGFGALQDKLAAAEALLGRIAKYVREDKAHTPGSTRLARVLHGADAHRTSAQPSAPSRTEAGANVAEAKLAAAEALLARINRRGGCGLDVHGWIDAHLAGGTAMERDDD